MRYESPEIIEIGMAEEFIHGMGPQPESDACDCTRRADPQDWD